MLAPTLLAEIRDAPAFRVWRGAVSIPAFPPDLLRDRIPPGKNPVVGGLAVEMRIWGVPCRESFPPACADPLEWLAGRDIGGTLQFRGSSLLWPELGDALEVVSQATGIKAQGVSIFWSCAGHRGLHPHTDNIHALQAHVAGQKKWYRLDESHKVLEEVVLSPGDALVMRPAVWHVCDPITDCQHVSLRLVPPRKTSAKGAASR